MSMTPTDNAFSEEQKQYLHGFASGSGLAHSLTVLPTWQSTLPAPAAPVMAESSDLNIAAQDRTMAQGKKLCPEEQAKRNLNGLDTWDLVLEHARDGRFPKGTDVFLMKFQGMFYVAPAQDSFMCRLRVPGGIMSTAQFRGVADLAEQFGGGSADVTTRANLQLRQIGPKHTADVLMGLHDLGIVNRGAGADNIRNVTASPTAGVDPQELIDTRPLARQMHHYILNHREMYGLPRKFNIAFDGGGLVSALEDTNDIGFTAVRVRAGVIGIEAGIYFHLTLGGITGHKDFARGTGILLKPDECIPVAAAIVRAFIDHGDRTDRKKARLKYVLDRMGHDAFLADAEKHLPTKLHRAALDACEPRPEPLRLGHVGIHPQKQPGFSYVGVVLPVGRMTYDQMRQLAAIAERFGSGTIRLTVWQNLLISDIRNEDVEAVKRAIEGAGLGCSATNIRGALIACTGSAGCKFAAADTKRHAMQLAEYLDARVQLDQPINIHLTGCHHSCAQHYIGDIGLLATKVPVDEDLVEGYHVYVGGGYGPQQGIGRELFRNVTADDVPLVVERVLTRYLAGRASPEENFLDFVRRFPIDDLARLLAAEGVTP
jgi:ferredoxin-nitrite reductase